LILMVVATFFLITFFGGLPLWGKIFGFVANYFRS